MLDSYEEGYMTGWFGVQGDMTGRKSSKIHVVNKDGYSPICGTVLSPKHIFQFNSAGIHEPYVECKNCIREINKIKEGNT